MQDIMYNKIKDMTKPIVPSKRKGKKFNKGILRILYNNILKIASFKQLVRPLVKWIVEKYSPQMNVLDTTLIACNTTLLK